jgi:hypothetical protein
MYRLYVVDEAMNSCYSKRSCEQVEQHTCCSKWLFLAGAVEYTFVSVEGSLQLATFPCFATEEEDTYRPVLLQAVVPSQDSRTGELITLAMFLVAAAALLHVAASTHLAKAVFVDAEAVERRVTRETDPLEKIEPFVSYLYYCY